MPARIKLIRNGRAVTDDATGVRARAALRDKKLSAYTKKKMTQLWRVAIRDCIRAMVDAWMAKPGHVDTGMALASMLPLARATLKPTRKKITGAVSEVKRGLASKKRGFRRKAYVDFLGEHDPTKNKSIAQGERDGQGGYDIQVGTPKHPIFLFEFNIQVFQWLYHEELSGGDAVGINALSRGAAAMRASVRRNYSTYLSAADYANIFTDKQGRF